MRRIHSFSPPSKAGFLFGIDGPGRWHVEPFPNRSAKDTKDISPTYFHAHQVFLRILKSCSFSKIHASIEEMTRLKRNIKCVQPPAQKIMSCKSRLDFRKWECGDWWFTITFTQSNREKHINNSVSWVCPVHFFLYLFCQDEDSGLSLAELWLGWLLNHLPEFEDVSDFWPTQILKCQDEVLHIFDKGLIW